MLKRKKMVSSSCRAVEVVLTIRALAFQACVQKGLNYLFSETGVPELLFHSVLPNVHQEHISHAQARLKALSGPQK